MDAFKLQEFSELREMRSAVITNEIQFYEISNLLWPKLLYLNHIMSIKSLKKCGRSSTVQKLKYLSESVIKKTRENHFLRSEVTLLQKTRNFLNEYIIQQAAVIAGFNNKNAISSQYSARKSCHRQNISKKETAASNVLKKAKKCRRKKNISYKDNLKNDLAASSNAALCDQFLDGEAFDEDSFSEIDDNHPDHSKIATEKSPNVFKYNVHKIGVKSEPLSDCEQEYQSSALFTDDSMHTLSRKDSDSGTKMTPSSILDLKESNNSTPSLVERSVQNLDNSMFGLDELFDQQEETGRTMCENSDNIFNCINSQMSSVSY